MSEGIERREVVLPLSPPRRLLAPTRYRSLKMLADQAVWDTAWQRVEALRGEGWEMEGAEIDWGRSVPYLGERRESLLGKLFPPGLPVVCLDRGSGGTRGRTVVHLVRLLPDGP